VVRRTQKQFFGDQLFWDRLAPQARGHRMARQFGRDKCDCALRATLRREIANARVNLPEQAAMKRSNIVIKQQQRRD
jgi:hypothetical protein